MSDEMSKALRAAIESCGLSANDLAKACDVPQTVISRFMRGYDIRLTRAEKIAAYLGLELRKKR